MNSDPALTALSPLDGRYRRRLSELAAAFSETALIKARLEVEIAWFIALADWSAIAELPPLDTAQRQILRTMLDEFDATEAAAVKTIEARTNHDVKAVEYYLKDKLASTSLAPHLEFIHFACTSEDINNLAHALMLKTGIGDVWSGEAEKTRAAIHELADKFRQVPMLAHTHGQPASPTTVGKEMAVFHHRLSRQLEQLHRQPYLGKINGAVGNFNAHVVAYPHADWPAFAQRFVENSLGLTYNPLTTQIESHDYMAELFHILQRFNSIIIDFDRDVWLYISKGYFRERLKAGEVGSSTMPHKVNPIDFENSEGNMEIANGLLQTLAQKLMISRLQRDLSDSTVLRNMGVAVGHSLLALKSTQRGIGKLTLDEARLQAELEAAWEILAEPIQTLMRKAGVENPYEQLKEFSRGKRLTAADVHAFIHTLPITEADRKRLLALTPSTYTGLAAELFT